VSYAVGARARATVLAGVELDLDAGGTLAVLGESGAGKSTLLAALLGLLPHGARVERGSVRFRGAELVGAPRATLRNLRGKAIGLVSQDALAALDPVVRVGVQVGEALVAHGACSRSEARARALDLLARCRLPEPGRVARAYPHELSGGMRQRALVAAALAMGPALVLADEPTSALDPTLALGVLDLLERERAERGAALLFVTHELVLARERCARTTVLWRGRVVEDGPTAALLDRPAHPYTLELAAARRALASPGAPLPPRASGGRAFAGGCPYAPRCPFARERCAEAVPELLPVGGDPTRRSACFFPEEVSP
jgi:oligopeptide/dipeptide ABC transporter ATP-binding protein